MLNFQLTKISGSNRYCVEDIHTLNVLEVNFGKEKAIELFKKIDILMYGSTVLVIEVATDLQPAKLGMYPHDLACALQTMGFSEISFFIENLQVNINRNQSGLNYNDI
ncbi:hypothetical protein [Vibrio campbellii]|uniref:hypothetical protein n=1 Tax=Vibrio campbellii TaxID=680 RepID=UPI0005C529C8